MSQPILPSTSTIPTTPTSTLLSLPVEIRLQIYTILFNRRNPHVPKQLYHLPSACHQLRDEAFPILLKETRHFSNIPSFIEWVHRGRWKWVSCVRDMSISTYAETATMSRDRGASRQFPVSLGDVSRVALEGDGDVIDVKWWERRYARKLAAIKDGGNEMALSTTPSQKLDYDDVARKVTRYSEQFSADRRRLRRSKRQKLNKLLSIRSGQQKEGGNQEEEEEEDSGRPRISNVWNSLIRLRSTLDLRLNLGRYHDVSNYETVMSKPDAEQEIFLEMISLAMPNLRSLILITTLFSLPVLQHFQNLTHLEFSGHSLSSPSETLEVLRSLPNLTSLSLGRGPTMYDKDNGLDTVLLHSYRCITEEVLRGLNPLLTLRIVHLTKAHASPFLTKGMLRAALGSHSMSLRELRLFSDHAIDRDAFQALLDLLPRCLVLERINLVLNVAGFREAEMFDISDYLPPSVYIKDILLR